MLGGQVPNPNGAERGLKVHRDDLNVGLNRAGAQIRLHGGFEPVSEKSFNGAVRAVEGAVA